MKEYNDKRSQAKEQEFTLGKTVLVKQKKTTTKPYFHPDPYTEMAPG